MRNTIIKKLKEVRPDIDLRDGSPLGILLVDVLTAVAANLVESIEQKHEIDANTLAEMFLLNDGETVAPEFVLRLYFDSPTSLYYQTGEMLFQNASGATFYNKNPVSMKASYMTFYIDNGFYYYDVITTGSSPVTGDMELTWVNPPTSFSHMVVTSIISSGSPISSGEALRRRIRNELSLRNNISAPGIAAHISDAFPEQLVDVMVQGFLDPEMQRDIVSNLHVGGCADVYVKGQYPQLRNIAFDAEPRERIRTMEVTSAETLDGAVVNLPHESLLTITVESWVRQLEGNGWENKEKTVFTLGTDYTVNMEDGSIRFLNSTIDGISDITNPPPRIMSGVFQVGSVTESIVVSTVSTPPPRVLVGSILKYNDDDYYLVNGVTYDSDTTTLLLDRPFAGNPSEEVYVMEPVRIRYTYHPIGVEFSEMQRPVLAVQTMNILDPLTDEATGDVISHIDGFGSGVFGAGPFGRGDVKGWETIVDDPNFRYSTEEQGFLEISRDYDLERIGIDYYQDSFVPQVAAMLDLNRPKTTDMKAFSFVPCIMNATLRADTENIDLSELKNTIWAFPNKMEISDIINKLYELGATVSYISDFYDNTTYKVWNRNGTFVIVEPDQDGFVELAGVSERFFPMTIRIIKND